LALQILAPMIKKKKPKNNILLNECSKEIGVVT